MLKWTRRLRLSLAVKCQLLFGAALVLIIGAALFAPWRRMQDLTAQRTARIVYTLRYLEERPPRSRRTSSRNMSTDIGISQRHPRRILKISKIPRRAGRRLSSSTAR